MIYVTPTPIGNLDDITVRAFKVLSKVKIILCEDGKVTSKLLKLLKIDNKPKYINLVRNNKFNESGIRLALSQIYEEILDLNYNQSRNKISIQIQNPTDLETDQNVIAIVTDAGTPGISDPAFEIIELLQELNLDYTVLPGSTACIPAIVTSNLVSKEFTFIGFLPLKKGRQTIWKEIKISKYPVIIYESCHRIKKLIEEIQFNLQSTAKVSISQEISKKHENTWIGSVQDLNKYQIKEKGEFVIVIKN